MTAQLAPTVVSRGTGLLYRANPVTLVVGAIVLSVPLFLTVDWVSALVALVLEVLLFVAAGVPLGQLVRRSWPLAIGAPLAALSMVLYGKPEGREYFAFWLAHITDGSIALAIAIAIRVFAIGIPAILMFSTIDPTDFADSLAQLVRLPSNFVLGTLAGTRLVSLFLDDWRTMAMSRRARGIADHAAPRRFAMMAFAVLVLAIRRGSKLATAMEARGFGAPTQRTWARQVSLTWVDAVLFVACLLIVAAATWAAVAAGTYRPVWSG
ncbi:MAG TPA: energy-coupling factor transporter transmembrane component T [Candidatus Lumbricidophila sp.]|nr:energy-coupling factor transporter transmembrane component T [Candidatus Lumbricidophila sp.]